MEREQAEVLLVKQHNRIEGLVFKIDLLYFNNRQKKELEAKVAERTRENERQNELLRQISWTQSHETRQPVATIPGLINIFDKSSLTKENLEIMGLLEETVNKLDKIIRETVVQANS